MVRQKYNAYLQKNKSCQSRNVDKNGITNSNMNLPRTFVSTALCQQVFSFEAVFAMYGVFALQVLKMDKHNKV